MDESLFWTQLQQVIRQSDYEAEVAQAQWEQLVRSSAAPTLPTQLIIQTVCSVINHKHPIYFKQRSPLNLPAITPNISFSKKQRLALELSLSNSPITLITGSPGSGKTRIATALANAAVNHQKRVLILTHHSAALTAFHELPGYPFALSHPQNYRNWLIDQLERQLAQPQMDYLPLHLLPDRELAQLRTRARLETWLPIIKTTSQQQLTELLQQAFPYLCEARTQLFAYRLRQLAPLLWENLNLSQLYERLSNQGIIELADYLINSSQVPIIGTVEEFMQPQHQFLWQTTFDLVIVEEAHYLTWFELMLLAGLGQKLVLLGDAVSRHSHQPSASQTFFTRPHSFDWLAQNLLPTYRCYLPEQFRLHPDIAAPVYGALCDDWIQTHRQRGYPYLPQLTNRLIWQDVPRLSLTAANQIWEFLWSIGSERSSQMGIITFETAQRDWLQTHCPQEFSHILIGTVAEWAGQERDIAIISCVGQLENVEPEDLNVALTRGRDYLILFGDYDYWWQPGSLMRPLLAQTEIQKNRMVILHES